jgi:membrane protein implicated in regulation of membrane protease activity
MFRFIWRRSPADVYAIGITLLVIGLAVAAYLLDVSWVWVLLFAVAVLAASLTALYRRARREQTRIEKPPATT